ncbi:hypothetical protein O1L60_45635 [Streptomyces diastatochromogenes]|nr:hypothetical protein [Streptomyces diastatochromogenes]
MSAWEVTSTPTRSPPTSPGCATPRGPSRTPSTPPRSAPDWTPSPTNWPTSSPPASGTSRPPPRGRPPGRARRRRLAALRLRALREIRTVAEQLADRTVAAAGIRGAGYPQLGDAWAITRQGARKKWPHAVSAMSEPPAGQEPRTTLDAFGGSVDLSWHGDEGGWWWIGEAADGTTGESAITHDTKEQAAADAGAFLKEHARTTTTDGDPK